MKVIPKNLIYAWFGGANKPQDFARNLNNWKKMCPNFKIIEINETNFDINSYQFTKEAYDQKKWAFVSDVARLWAVQTFGGIYLDTDVEILKPLDKLLHYSEFWGKEDETFIASGLIFGAEAQTEHIKEILAKYETIHFPIEEEKLYTVSTVRIITDYFLRHGLSVGNKNQVLDGKTAVFNAKYFAPLHYWGGGHLADKAITVHHYSSSWTNSNYKYVKHVTRYLLHEIAYHVPFCSYIVHKVIDLYKK